MHGQGLWTVTKPLAGWKPNTTEYGGLYAHGPSLRTMPMSSVEAWASATAEVRVSEREVRGLSRFGSLMSSALEGKVTSETVPRHVVVRGVIGMSVSAAGEGLLGKRWVLC